MRAWLNVGEAAEYAGVCKDTIYTACERNELRHVRIGGRRCIRMKAAWLDEWFERNTRCLSGVAGGAVAASTPGASVGR
ncbi:MAG TPA: helix-turn-helix domain-containing protein [Luteitalea sp.]|nr:helix-turn-helix domain-containing protein [Luteitalea sp.]